MSTKVGRDAAPVTKILSVRMPVEEAERVDVLAKAAGLNRNDYIRLCLTEKAVFADSGKLDDAIKTLRSLERLQETYVEQLVALLRLLAGEGCREEDLTMLRRQVGQGERLMEDLFKAQRKTVRIIDGVYAKLA